MVSCFDDYITISQAYRPSRSSLYADQLPGISEDLIDNLARDPADDANSIWPILYKRAVDNLVSDIAMNLNKNFHVDYKIVSRETSQYKDDENQNSGLAGVKITFTLPKYAVLHIVKLEVKSEISYGSPGVNFKFFDTNQDGELLHELTDSVDQGKSVVNVDTDFLSDSVFVAYDTAQADFKQTENKYYYGMDLYGPITCDYCFSDVYRANVEQINGGGIDVFFNIRCSVTKFVCENLNLFRKALLYKIGQEITAERRLGERLTRYQTMDEAREKELKEFYDTQYNENLENSLKNMSMNEDPICFQCKPTVYVRTDLP